MPSACTSGLSAKSMNFFAIAAFAASLGCEDIQIFPSPIHGGDGNDFIYASHGRNAIYGGGKDTGQTYKHPSGATSRVAESAELAAEQDYFDAAQKHRERIRNIRRCGSRRPRSCHT